MTPKSARSRTSRKGKSAPASGWSRSDSWKLAALCLLAAMAFAGGLWLDFREDYLHALDVRLAQWKNDFHLTDTEAAQLRQLEIGFHGTGNPFALRQHPNHEQSRAHHETVAVILHSEGVVGDPRPRDPDQ